MLRRRIELAFKKAGIEHNDIRPNSVLRGLDGSLRLIDFGLAQLVTPELTKEGGL